ncbi:MAG: type II toxin-antitoxin system RelE/ParE family toxin [Tissierellia bacterium]|nr:type II toxin-antitoxin system RelE/ParE family toxin [Tissierellia bacterium]MDD3227574.1 type II toxin-antitoxin system RelE/ParE family toxin [Tissierellia bacterium]MDD3751243.1 type II toxin-antitoxin system RelE/ParE family toxin [Tissierellia bacterium]MDD4679093.1 type II toxin-antitoxin system RelE/ParE family toxin [Tissierellia bacterium]
MKSYKIKLLITAVRDLDDLIENLSQFSSEVALRQYDRIIEKVNLLKEFPEMCQGYITTVCGYKYRKLVIDNYLVFYIVKNEVIEIHRIINSRMNIDNIID